MVHFLLPFTPFEPIGGVRTAFDYVMRLNELAGQQIADILADSPYVKSWLPTEYQQVKVLPTSTPILTTDTLLIPEVIPLAAKDYAHVMRKFLVVLNWKFLEEKLNWKELKNLGYTGILTNSNYSLQWLKKNNVKLPIWHIPQFINSATFKTAQKFGQRPKNSILVMSRKNSQHLPGLISFLRNFSHTLTVMNNIAPEKMADQYANNQVFINLGYPEGFCRPAAEAMASKCLVIGFTGGGGLDFMRDGATALIAEDGNERQLLEKLNLFLQMTGKEKLQIVENGHRLIISQYSMFEQAKALSKIFSRELGELFTLAKLKAHYHVRRDQAHPLTKITLQSTQTVEGLQYRYFLDHQKYQELIDSKFFRFWQLYSNVKHSFSLKK